MSSPTSPRLTQRSGRGPVLFVLDHDRRSLDVVLSALSRRFGNDFTVTGETSAQAALCALEEMAETGKRVALLLVDDPASDFLDRAHSLHPLTKRVFVVNRDYRSASPAVQAMALGRVDYHLVRPWADDETLYRAMSEYLESWRREQEPRFEEFRIVAAEGDSRALQLRDVMTRFSMPFGLYASDSRDGRRLLEEAGLDATRLPVVIRYDGQVSVDPSLPDLAQAIGVNVKNDLDTCDVAVVGAGPAGLAAAVYAASEGLETVLLELAVSGGQAGTSPLIRNYPGFPHGIEGGLLMERTCEQAWLMGAHIVFAQQAVALECHGDERVVRLLDGTEVRARALVIATGIEWRRLGIPRVEALIGAGVFYGAAVSESRAMQDQDVFVVGAGNSAGQAALHLAKYARTATLLVRGGSIAKSMSSYLVNGIEATPNIRTRLRTEIIDAGGSETLESLVLTDHASASIEEVPASALFIMIGGEPHTDWLPDEIARDERGYIITGRNFLEQPELTWKLDREPLTLETSIAGVFAAGDVRQDSIKRVASAVGDGATAIRLVHEHLRTYSARALLDHAHDWMS
ncbi:MAG TPA: FAD-dependent oxidoreductase [Solirubrobacteraceae bacterium]|nr:FAD-dependent oxidoreductase [Solirubrobacteraceae bacterium]